MLKRLLLSLLLLTAVLNATTPTQENVTKLYVATFERAPDAGGLAYWLNSSGLDLEGIAMSFFVQPETKEKYPAGTMTSVFVESVYANLFNRTPDAGGLEYWIVELDSGNISRSVFILAVINGALEDDAIILKHKMEVGLYFAERGLDNVDDAILVMADITEDPATVADAKKLIDEMKPPAPPVPSNSVLKKTGQTKSYMDFDDGYYQLGITTSYTRDNAKNIVRDNVTGLQWQDDEAAKIVEKTWSEAVAYCSALSLDGGGWRLPSKSELAGLIDYGRADLAIDTAFQNTSTEGRGEYWSSTTFAGSVGACSWYVSFKWGGGIGRLRNSTPYHIRCVR